MGGAFAFFSGPLRKGPPFHGSRSSREIKLRNATVKRVVAKLQRDETASLCRQVSGREVTGYKSASQSSMELCDPWISGPFLIFQGFFGPGPLQKCVGDFCSINVGGFAGIFLEDFSGQLFPPNNEQKKAGDKIRQLKKKNAKNRSAQNRS